MADWTLREAADRLLKDLRPGHFLHDVAHLLPDKSTAQTEYLAFVVNLAALRDALVDALRR